MRGGVLPHFFFIFYFLFLFIAPMCYVLFVKLTFPYFLLHPPTLENKVSAREIFLNLPLVNTSSHV